MKQIHEEEHSKAFQVVTKSRKNRKEREKQESKPGVRVFLPGIRLTVHRQFANLVTRTPGYFRWKSNTEAV